jgi:bile acid:Na+ symporter, BASS family
MTLDLFVKILSGITVFEMMVALGLGVTAAELASSLRNWRLVTKALVANYVVVPAAAVGLLLLFQAHPLVAVGFLIGAVCPGAPFIPPFTGMARGNVLLSVGLMVLLAASSAVLAPLLLQFLLPLVLPYLPPLPPDSPPVQVNAGSMIGTLLFTQLLPLALGLGLRHWRPALAARLLKPAKLLSLILGLATLGVILAVQFGILLEIPLRAYGGMTALVFASVAGGWLLGGPGRANRAAVAMATGVRNVGVCLVIATVSFPGTKAVTATTAFALFQTILVALVALAWGRFAAPATTSGPAPAPSGSPGQEHVVIRRGNQNIR